MSVFDRKTPVVKLFENLRKTQRRLAPFYFYQDFPFEFWKVFINSRFTEHRPECAFQ